MSDPAYTARRPLLVVVSDFDLFDPDPATVTAIMARHKALAVVLGAESAPLSDHPDITVQGITSTSPPTTLIDAISDRLTRR